MAARESTERVLVVALGEDPDVGALRDALARRGRATVRVVAPAHVGPLEWYGNDEHASRARAESRARRGARALTPVADVEATAGEPDPVLAVEDALSGFPAERIVIAGTTEPDLEESLRALGLPVERLEPPSEPSDDGLREAGRAIMSGRSGATPYAIFAGVMLAALVLIGLLALLAVLLI